MPPIRRAILLFLPFAATPDAGAATPCCHYVMPPLICCHAAFASHAAPRHFRYATLRRHDMLMLRAIKIREMTYA